MRKIIEAQDTNEDIINAVIDAAELAKFKVKRDKNDLILLYGDKKPFEVRLIYNGDKSPMYTEDFVSYDEVAKLKEKNNLKEHELLLSNMSSGIYAFQNFVIFTKRTKDSYKRSII